MRGVYYHIYLTLSREDKSISALLTMSIFIIDFSSVKVNEIIFIKLCNFT